MRRASVSALPKGWMIPVAALLVANVVVFAAWTWPRWSARRSVTGAASGFEDARRQIEPRLELAREGYGRVVSAERDLATFRERLVTQGGGAGLIALLSGAGARVGIDLEDVSFQLGRSEELGVVQLAINLPVEGTYESVRGLLDELVAVPVFLVIESVVMSTTGVSSPSSAARSGPTGSATQGRLRLDLAVSVFLEDPEGAAVAATAPGGAQASDATAAVRRAAAARDTRAVAENLIERLASLRPLSVDPEALVLNLDRLDRSYESLPPSRNLFSIATPPPPATPLATEPALEELPGLEPAFPVRLVGLLEFEGRRHASFSDGIDLFIATAGERLPNGVEIVELGADYAEVVFGETRTRLTLEGTKP